MIDQNKLAFEQKTVEEALTSEEGEQWKKAMDEEMEDLRAMGTWV